MRLLFDQNISQRILKLLPEEYKYSSHVLFEKLENASDKKIWEFAKANNFTIVSQDSDFNDLVLLEGFPPKIIWIKAGNLKTDEIAKIVLEHSNNLIDFISNDEFGCYEIFKFE